MKHKIKEAIETTLVVENKKSIDLCVEKIIKLLQEKSDCVSSDSQDITLFGA